ncbi:unnamed protein product [Menidia menidia]|uniref:(Atlantic silverside) hypothetical protein n=1 Tax=Menidia menidia TaxID=238744 RepID=A0A8S4BJR2_9TELE|nr:unnamed protein product [Menidia menidia]
MNCPPTKRLRGLNQEVVTTVAFNDPFGDDEEFTQDDLDEIDIIASQAITSAPGGAGVGSKPGAHLCEAAPGSSWSSSTGQSKPGKVTAGQIRESTFGLNRGHAGKPCREPLGEKKQQFEPDREDSYRHLQAQHAELRKKLKEVEEEILLKSGEIRVLRDTLKTAQQEKDAQRQAQMMVEAQKQKEQSDREKELNRKVQSLQSELQFKEAEINQMKTKLHSSDKNKTASPLPRNSPKVLNSGCSSSPTGNGFMSKEAFGAQISSRTTPVKTPSKTRQDDRGASSSRQEPPRPDPFLSVRPALRLHRGGVLLGLLLQQPLSPGGLGLSHLLSIRLTDSSQQSAGGQLQADLLAAASIDGRGGPRHASSLVQSLAVTGLNMLSQSQPAPAARSRKNRSCPGAVLLLPLLDLHLSQLCRALDSLCPPSAGGGGPESRGSGPAPAGSAPPGSGEPEEPGALGFSPEDTGLAALRILLLLLAHSDEVVEAVLLKQNHSPDNKNALLPSLLLLCDVRLVGGSAQREELVHRALETLCVLIEKTPPTLSDRLQSVLPVVCACVSAGSRPTTISACVSVLTSMSDHRTLAVVRLLNRLTQRAESWTASVQVACPCYTEMVQIAVIIFHRQWLELRGSQEPAGPRQSSAPCWPLPGGPKPALLRECLLLLHWLLLHHASFSESCRPLLHMYDQVIPAVRDTLRRIPRLSESEELALEEICRSEGDEAEDMDTDAGP